MAQDERERFRQAGFSDDEIDAYFGKRQASPTPAAAAPAAPEGGAPTQRLRSIAQGATLGLADEAEAAFRSLSPNQTYQSAIEDVRGKLKAYREERPLEAMGFEAAGGLATGVLGGARALAATAGRTGARELGKALARKAVAGSVGQGVISGAAGAEGSVLTEEGRANRLKGAAVGGTIAAALPFGVSKLARIPGIKDVGESIGRGYSAVQRGAADALEGTRLQGLGRLIEPSDAIRTQRMAAENLPGGVAGPTTASMDFGTEATRAAKIQAEIAAKQGRLTAQQAKAARSEAQESARETIQGVKKEESAITSLAKQKAGAIRGVGASRAKRLEEASKGLTAQAKQEEAVSTSLLRQRAGEVKEAGVTRAERLAGTSKEAKAQARELQRIAKQEADQVAAATREQAKTAAQDVLAQAKAEAGEAVAGLRGSQPSGSAARLQESVRAKQLKEAEGHYEAVRAVGAPPDPDVSIYREIFDDPSLQSAYKGSAAAFPKEMRNAAPGTPALARPRMITINGEDVPEITLETMDQMRRRILNPPYDPNKVGLSRSQRAQALNTIDRLEQRYLAGFGTDDAAEALRTARGAYREKFQILEAVRDGLNLGTVKAGKASGLLTQSRKELDEVAKRVENMTPKQRTAFQVGAREWFDRFVQESPDNALGLAKKFSSEASQRRLALAFGDDAVEVLRQFAPDVINQQRKAASARVREEGRQVVQSIMGRAGEGATALETRAARAAELAERAKTQGATRAEQLIAQREAEAARGVISAPTIGRASRAVGLAQRAEEQSALRSQQILGQRGADAATRIADTQRKVGATVREAREQARTAQSEADRLAQELTQASIAQSQAKQLPVRDIERALGTSTQQQVFLQRLFPQMTPSQRQDAVQVVGSNLQRELQDIARKGGSQEQMMQRIRELQQNDVVRTLFAPQVDAFVQNLNPSIGTRIPGAVRPAVSGVLGRLIGRNFNE